MAFRVPRESNLLRRKNGSLRTGRRHRKTFVLFKWQWVEEVEEETRNTSGRLEEIVECETSRRPRPLACSSPFARYSPTSLQVPPFHPSLSLCRRPPLGILVAYKLTAGTDSAVSTVFHVIRSRIIYLTTLGARSRNFYCFVTPGGADGPGVEDARKLDCDVDAIVLLGVFACAPLSHSRTHPPSEGDGDFAGS